MEMEIAQFWVPGRMQHAPSVLASSLHLHQYCRYEFLKHSTVISAVDSSPRAHVSDPWTMWRRCRGVELRRRKEQSLYRFVLPCFEFLFLSLRPIVHHRSRGHCTGFDILIVSAQLDSLNLARLCAAEEAESGLVYLLPYL